MYFYIIVLFLIDIYSTVNIFYSIIIFSLLINAVILLFNCLVVIYVPFLIFRHYFLCLNIIDLYITDNALKVSRSVSLLLYLIVLKNVSPGCGVQASVMLFFEF